MSETTNKPDQPLDAPRPSVGGGDVEQCICAAIKLPNGEVWRGHRHDGAFKYAAAAGVEREALHAAEQGFITSRNRFVGREEGARIQNAAGIVSADTGGPIDRVLFSEDLYLRDWRSPESHDEATNGANTRD